MLCFSGDGLTLLTHSGLANVGAHADSDARRLSTALLAGYSNFHVNHVGHGRTYRRDGHVSYAVELQEEERAQGGTMDQRRGAFYYAYFCLPFCCQKRGCGT